MEALQEGATDKHCSWSLTNSSISALTNNNRVVGGKGVEGIAGVSDVWGMKLDMGTLSGASEAPTLNYHNPLALSS